ncbi:MAG: 3-oxoacyl-[acyl-carrier-protein] reductase [Bacteroidetes bacterium GWE2_29_8]|nr:MAG: 3-oxoacyl-[acyl-carrier-protein] reductase [Bacteroidetes bacterium GWE2_29_8]OFY15133.1 MAG: 3-oxoacyl-[acyl-carrier-protein] reductase [Bacteroidetes bacterium GWF2_29_10]
MKLLEGKVALITGASRGIGKSIAICYAKNGCNVAFTDISRNEAMLATEEELKSYGVKAVGYASDASSYSDSELLIDNILKDFPTINIIVNNAGITRDNLLMRLSEENWDDVMRINLKSVFNITKASLKVLLKQKSGSIINMSSVVGIEGNAGQSNYSASKAGIIGFTKSIAQELGSRNIRCNAVAPGFIETEMTSKLPDDIRVQWIKDIPLKRAGKPEDVANLALFLASDLSDYISGQVINVCGGMQT